MDVLGFFGMVLKASLFSSGGMGNFPSLHADLIAKKWATEQHFGEALAVGQVSPGPNGLWVVCLGYLVGGVSGAIAALFAILLPPLLVLLVARLYQRVKHHPAVEGFIRGLSLAVIGVFVVVLFGLLTNSGLSLRTFLTCGGALALAASRRVPVVVILGLAALLGIVWR
jgi:chromate transporter